jgi:tRNA A58 N-methylase Trm61
MSHATIIRDTDLTAQSVDASVLDAPDPNDYVEVVQESFCLACQAPVG